MTMAGEPEAQVEGDPAQDLGTGAAPKAVWPLYEVFVRGKRGLNHVHVGSLHAPDRKSTRLNSSHSGESRMPSSA